MEDEGRGFVDRALKKYSSRVAYSYIDTENTVRHMTYACVRENIGCFKHLIGLVSSVWMSSAVVLHPISQGGFSYSPEFFK